MENTHRVLTCETCGQIVHFDEDRAHGHVVSILCRRCYDPSTNYALARPMNIDSDPRELYLE